MTAKARGRRWYGYFLAALTGAAITGVLVAVALAVGADTSNDYHRPEARPTAANVGPLLVEKHNCWTQQAPAGVSIPGHVVVTTAEGRTVYGGRRLTGLALEQVFDHIDHGLTVWGFCR